MRTKHLMIAAVATLGLLGCEPMVGKKTESTIKPAKPAAPAVPVDISTVIGQQAPKFQLNLLNGSKVTNESLQGQVVLLDFWATWCKYCVAASPTMQRFSETFPRDQFRVIGVNTLEEVENPQADEGVKMSTSMVASEKYVKEHKYTFDFAFYGDKLAEDWKFKGLPMLILLDTHGAVAMVKDSATPDDLKEIEAKIKSLLEESQ